MSLQQEVNDQVAAIHEGLDQAAAAALAVGVQIGAIDDQEIDHSTIRAAFVTVAQAIGVISGALDTVADALDDISLTPGEPGAAATIEIDAVIPLNPGSLPTVENVGSPSDALLRFGLPRGATIQVGSVTALSPGSEATIVNVGSQWAAVFNFGIPVGATGSAGPISFGDEDPNDLVWVEGPPPVYIQTISPHKVWKRIPGVGYEDIT